MSIGLFIFAVVVCVSSWAIFYDEGRRERFGLVYLALLLISCISLGSFVADRGADLERFTREAIDQQRQKLKDKAALKAKVAMAKIDRRLQAGPKRLMCYDGIVDGKWGDQSAEALNRLIVAVGLEKKYPDGAKIPIIEIEKMIAKAKPEGCSKPPEDTAKEVPVTTSSKAVPLDWKRNVFRSK